MPECAPIPPGWERKRKSSSTPSPELEDSAKELAAAFEPISDIVKTQVKRAERYKRAKTNLEKEYTDLEKIHADLKKAYDELRDSRDSKIAKAIAAQKTAEMERLDTHLRVMSVQSALDAEREEKKALVQKMDAETKKWEATLEEYTKKKELEASKKESDMDKYVKDMSKWTKEKIQLEETIAGLREKVAAGVVYSPPSPCAVCEKKNHVVDITELQLKDVEGSYIELGEMLKESNAKWGSLQEEVDELKEKLELETKKCVSLEAMETIWVKGKETAMAEKEKLDARLVVVTKERDDALATAEWLRVELAKVKDAFGKTTSDYQALRDSIEILRNEEKKSGRARVDSASSAVSPTSPATIEKLPFPPEKLFSIGEGDNIEVAFLTDQGVNEFYPGRVEKAKEIFIGGRYELHFYDDNTLATRQLTNRNFYTSGPVKAGQWRFSSK